MFCCGFGVFVGGGGVGFGLGFWVVLVGLLLGLGLIGFVCEGCGVVGAGQVDGIAKYAKVCTERAKLTESARNTPISLFFVRVK